MRQTSLVGAALLFLQSAAAANNVVVESLPSVPTGWKKLRDARPDQPIRLRIALEQPNLDVFERTLYDISDPHHALYGRHLSREALRESRSSRGRGAVPRVFQGLLIEPVTDM